MYIPFPHSESQARRLLDLIHSDVCGPFPQSIGGYRYFITFIDDHSRHLRIYYLKKKSDAFSKFKLFRAAAKNATGTDIKVYRTDGGGEYVLHEFEAISEITV